MKTALLLSGGMDSIALAYWRRPEIAITIDYGQKAASAEIKAASAVCSALNIPHEIVSVDCPDLGSGDMAGNAPASIAPVSEWWPFRNQLLITLAAMKLVQSNIKTLLIGCLVTDSAHADGRKEFIDSASALLSMQEGAICVEAPAIHLSSTELIKASGVPNHILAWAHSCHVSNYACGRCRGCVKHYNTYKELGYEPY